MAVCPNCGEANPDKAKFCQECASPLKVQRAAPQEARKTVTIMFCDLVGSTALGERLDSESLREVMDRYFAAMRAAIERHGGTVEKFIGDAVMAVFGVPRVHEDDALRAVRAADEMRRAVSTLNAELQRHWGVTVSNRIGVNTGEVVIGDASSGQRLATGDAVNVAARLEQAAPSGDVLMGEPTHRLVRDAVMAETVEPLALKGKSERMPAFRLVEVRAVAEGVARRLDAPLVGRKEEIGALLDAFERSAAHRSYEVVVVAGDAGVGKSRLIAEFRDQLSDRARVVPGRCMSYGEGIAFWPLREIVFGLAGAPEDASADEIQAAIHTLVANPPEVERLVAAIGLSARSFPPEETAWAVRRLFEAAADVRPLVIIVEDLHWAETALLDLLAHVGHGVSEGPILLLCSSRPEFLYEQRGWVEGLPRATVHVLHPLSETASADLVANLLDGAAVAPELVERITRAAAGNPLYVEQIASMWLDEGVLAPGGGRWQLAESGLSEQIPPTISALLSARLDRLAPEERTVAAAASVVGEVFYRGAVELLSPRVAAGTALTALERKGFVRGDDSVFFDEKVFAFRHALIRDAAYAGILKRTRAELHERFAEWLARKAGDRASEYDEILGYHLYEAYRYREELAKVGAAERALGVRAATYLTSAGRRGLSSQISTAATLLGRAARLLPSDHPDKPDLLIDLGESLRRSEETQRAEGAFTRACSLARALGNRDAEARANLCLLNIKMDEGQLTPDGLLAALGELEKRVGKLRNPEATAHAAALLGVAYVHQGTLAQARAQWASAVDQAERSVSNFVRSETRVGALLSALWGPVHVHEVLAHARDYLQWAEDAGALRLRAAALVVLAMGLTMRDRSDESEARLEELAQVEDQLGISAIAGESWSVIQPDLLIMSGEWTRAEGLLASRLEVLARMGIPAFMVIEMTQLGEVYYRQGRVAEAELLARRVRKMPYNDIESRIRADKLLGKCLARRARAGEELARGAVAIARHTDMLNLTADALCDLAEVLALEGGKERRVREPYEEAVVLYDRKGNVVSSAPVRSRLERL